MVKNNESPCGATRFLVIKFWGRKSGKSRTGYKLLFLQALDKTGLSDTIHFENEVNSTERICMVHQWNIFRLELFWKISKKRFLFLYTHLTRQTTPRFFLIPCGSGVPRGGGQWFKPLESR